MESAARNSHDGHGLAALDHPGEQTMIGYIVLGLAALALIVNAAVNFVRFVAWVHGVVHRWRVRRMVERGIRDANRARGRIIR